MKFLKNWWARKSDHKRQNWLLLALAACFIATGLVESGQWWPVAGILSVAITMVWFEINRFDP